MSSEDTPGLEEDFGLGEKKKKKTNFLINKNSKMEWILEWRQAKRDQAKEGK